jgi:hypothetical protein
MPTAARRWVIAFAILAVASAGGARAVHAQAAEEPLAHFYAGKPADIKVGTFPGKLVCLSCDLGGPGGKEECGRVGHRHALAAEDGKMVHPLIPATDEVLARINSNDLHGTNVKVHGKYYPALGSILVDKIEPAG